MSETEYIKRVNYKKLGMAIAYRRLERRLTQEKLAELAGLSPGYIGCMERGDRKISLDTLVSISTALHTTPNHLLADSFGPEIMESLDQPLILREPDYTLRNTLSNWYLADLPDESMLSDTPVSRERIAQLQFMCLDEAFPPAPVNH